MKKVFSKIALCLVAAIFLFTGCTQNSASLHNKKNVSSAVRNSTKVEAENKVAGSLKVRYIDVGQGDSELIQSNGQNMLIDTGTNESKTSLVNYLKSQNVKRIDYLVLTHPHEDHIGGADAVIKDFDIGTIYMPDVATNTRTFKDVLSEMKNKGLKANKPEPGTNFKVGDARCDIYGPVNTNKEDLNTYSIVIKLTFGKTKFMFTGDSQNSNEAAMIAKGYDLSADVLKVGHHGSRTSTSDEFLNKVNPKYAVISCGKNNDYGHPHTETMQRLQNKGIKLYRTDEEGTVVCTSDGNSISFGCNPGDYASGQKNGQVSNNSNKNASTGKAQFAASTQSTQAQGAQQKPGNDDRIVYYTPNGKSYHYDRNCVTLRRSKTVLSGKLSDVVKMGKSDPCDKCAH
ncbi:MULTISPECIES: ComEC/Rec2 family competence protein [Clostridium]|uniref:ComEC/Rec2 family competence protein n=1 Tax=Clostridium TaxID=1485 RepID=UPI0009BFB234|nr:MULTISPECIES: ComEC/Rec2 family competence protein [Clostridium]PJI10287.1 MBL fold metallo-hydrolase [Clostridium sp. CT7]